MRDELMNKIKAGESLTKSPSQPEALEKKLESKFQTYSAKDNGEKR